MAGDPILLGRFPEGGYEALPEEMELISRPLDYYGFNACQGSPHTMTGRNMTPEVTYWSPKCLYERYKNRPGHRKGHGGHGLGEP